MASPFDDEVAILEWDPEVAPTSIDVPVAEEVATDKTTAPHKTLGPEVDGAFESGREQGVRAGIILGQEDCLASLREVALKRGLTNDETGHLVLAVRLGLTKI